MLAVCSRAPSVSGGVGCRAERRAILMAGDRYVVLGLAHPRAAWFRTVAQWSHASSIPVELVKCQLCTTVEGRCALTSDRRSGASPAANRIDLWGQVIQGERHMPAGGQTEGTAEVHGGGDWVDGCVVDVNPSAGPCVPDDYLRAKRLRPACLAVSGLRPPGRTRGVCRTGREGHRPLSAPRTADPRVRRPSTAPRAEAVLPRPPSRTVGGPKTRRLAASSQVVCRRLRPARNDR